MATANIYLDTRKSVEGMGIIKILISHNRTPRLYSTNIKCTQDDYDKLKRYGSKLDSRVKDIDLINLHNLLYAPKNEKKFIYSDGYVLQAETIINQLGANFDFDKFKVMFDSYGKNAIIIKVDVLSCLYAKYEELRTNGQLSHGRNFELVGKSLNRFVNYLKEEYPQKLIGYKKKENFVLEFRHITANFLEEWKQWMLVEGKAPKSPKGTPTGASITTVGIYARTLRVTYNEAVKNPTIPIDKTYYPFGKEKGLFTIPKGKNTKKALSNAQLVAIKDYQPQPYSMEQRSHDLWLFSYFGNGMNFEDMLKLRWENLTDNEITFVRNKTKDKSDEEIEIKVRINDTMKLILERQATTRGKGKDFVFNFINAKDSLERQKAIIHQVIKTTNYNMNRIGAKLGIDAKLNTYEARHSFATKLMRSDAPLMLISQKLGHAKISTTENYLGSFEKETEDYYLDML